MPDRARRASADRIAARKRAILLADRYGRALKESRLALRLSQAAAADRAGVSQSFWSALERGRGTVASLETLAACAAAVGGQLAAYVEARPGAELPRDIEHLRRQELVLRVARLGGWHARPERPIDPAWSRSRSIDVLLERAIGDRRDVVVVEIEDWLADVGAALRNLDHKAAAIRREVPRGSDLPGSREVAGLLVVRGTSRNRKLVAELATLFETRFPARGRDWLAALADRSMRMPVGDGWLWTSVAGDRLIPPRQPRSAPAA